MKENVIFVHALKTGGTTVNAAMNDSFWQTKTGFYYRHILGESGKSNAGDIFKPENFEKYKQYKIITMMRHPVDRVISEYFFMKDRKVFMDLILNKPQNFSQFINSTQTANGMLNFFTGKRLYSTSLVRGSDLDDVLDAIDEIPISVGVFEQFEKSLQYFSNETGIKWKREIEVKRVTFRRPDKSEISDKVRQQILEKNALDVELYEYCLDRFNKINSHTKPVKIRFNKDKYNHVVPYCVKWNLFEFCMDNKKFLKSHFDFFKAFNFHLINTLGIRDGREFTKVWNKTFVDSIENAFPMSVFSNCVVSAYNNEQEDPLEETYQIAKAIDSFFENEENLTVKYYQPMVFKEELVQLKTKTSGFFSRLFKL